jgi:hypothetical protein
LLGRYSPSRQKGGLFAAVAGATRSSCRVWRIGSVFQFSRLKPLAGMATLWKLSVSDFWPLGSVAAFH